MRISDAFPSKHLKASDLQGTRAKVVMNYVDMQKIGDDTKPVLYFQGKQKGLVLNRVNSRIIADAYGDDTNSWTGGAIELFEAQVDFQGKVVPAIRVSIPRRNTQAPLMSHETAPPMQQRVPQQRAPAMAGDFTEDAPPPPQHAPQRVVSGIDDEVPF